MMEATGGASPGAELQGKLEKTLRYKNARLDFGEFAVVVRPAIPALNSAYAIALGKRMSPHQLSFTAGALSAETADRIMAEVYDETVIVMWEGDEVPENAVLFLRENPEDLHTIIEHATNLGTFMNERGG